MLLHVYTLCEKKRISDAIFVFKFVVTSSLNYSFNCDSYGMDVLSFYSLFLEVEVHYLSRLTKMGNSCTGGGDKASATTTHSIFVKTGDKKGADTNGNVRFKINHTGSSDSTQT